MPPGPWPPALPAIPRYHKTRDDSRAEQARQAYLASGHREPGLAGCLQRRRHPTLQHEPVGELVSEQSARRPDAGGLSGPHPADQRVHRADGGAQATIPQFQAFQGSPVAASNIGQYISGQLQNQSQAAAAMNAGIFDLAGGAAKLGVGMMYMARSQYGSRRRPSQPVDDPRGLSGLHSRDRPKYGIDPEVALRVAKSEGLASFKSGVKRKDGRRSPVGGAFQLYTGGGLGNKFKKETGLDPADPENEDATIDYALKYASQHGWGPWHGAKKVGVGDYDGIGGGGAKTAQRSGCGLWRGRQRRRRQRARRPGRHHDPGYRPDGPPNGPRSLYRRFRRQAARSQDWHVCGPRRGY